MAESLQPLPAPGLAIFPEFISSKPTTLIARGELFTSSYDITYAHDNSPFIAVESQMVSMSRRKILVHVPTNQELGVFRKEHMTMNSEYYADHASRGRLFDASTQFSFGGTKWQMEFGNAADGDGRKRITLQAKTHAFSYDTTVMWDGRPVAIIERKAFSMSGQTMLHIAPGLDPFIIIALAMAIADRRRAKSSAAGGGGGGGGGA